MTQPCQAQPQAPEPPAVIAVAGPAGSGKTTLGRALARQLHLPILDLDQLTNPLLDRLWDTTEGAPHWLAGADAIAVRDGRYAALRATAADIVAAGVGVILVAPFTAELTAGDAWRHLCAGVAPATVQVIFLDGAPGLLRARRLARGEERDAFREDAPVRDPDVPHITIDAALTVQQQLFRAIRSLGVRWPIDPDNPVFQADFDAVLFDLDGTLVDSTPSVVRAWSRLAEEFGFDPAAVQGNHGHTALNLLTQVVAPGLVTQAYSRITHLESTDTDGVIALPGAKEMLAALPAAARAIVTSGGRTVALARLTAAALPPVDVMVTADDVTHGKPDPEPYRLAARRLGVAPERCLVLEDAPAGIQSARLAGCTVIGVGGTCDPAELDVDLWLEGLDRVRVAPRGTGFGFEPLPSP